MMLPAANRLRRDRDFKKVYEKGIRRSGLYLSLRALCRQKEAGKSESYDLRKPSQETRIGISISKKVSKGAVVRNRIKRQIRAAARHLLPKISPGWDLVIVVKPRAVGCNYDDFLQELEQLLSKADFL